MGYKLRLADSVQTRKQERKSKQMATDGASGAAAAAAARHVDGKRSKTATPDGTTGSAPLLRFADKKVSEP